MPAQHDNQDAPTEQEAARFLAAYARTGNVDKAIAELAIEDQDAGRKPRITAWGVARWRRDEVFSRAYQDVRCSLGTRAAERVVDVAEGTLAGEYHPAAAQVHQRALQWYAARADRREWGDRQDASLEISGSIEHRNLGGELAAFVDHLLKGRAEAAPRPEALPEARTITHDGGGSYGASKREANVKKARGDA